MSPVHGRAPALDQAADLLFAGHCQILLADGSHWRNPGRRANPSRPREGRTTAPATLLDAARSGDARAFDQLVAPNRAELRAYCYRMLGSPHGAEHAVQEPLVRARRIAGGLDDEGSSGRGAAKSRPSGASPRLINAPGAPCPWTSRDVNTIVAMLANDAATRCRRCRVVPRQGRDLRLLDQRPVAIALAFLPTTPTAMSLSAPTCGTRRPGRTFPAASRTVDLTRFGLPARILRKGIRGRDAGDADQRNTRLQDPIPDHPRVTRFPAWLDGHAEVSCSGPVPCDVQPDRRSWPSTTRSGLWPGEATGMPAVPGEAWQQSLLAACVLFVARTGVGRGGRKAGPCSRWLPAGSRCG
jgi:hypothetical protein